MRLYVEELRDTALEQTFTRERAALVDRVRLHLCKYLSPAGTFKVTLKTEDGTSVLDSNGQTLADMQADGSTDLQANYYHGYVTFTFPRALTLRAGVTYRLALSATGYAYDADQFIGWVKAYEDRAIRITGGDEPLAPVDSPYDFEIYSLEKVR